MRIKKLSLATSLLTISIAPAQASAQQDFIERKYESFQVIMNCEKKGLQLYKATVGKDTGNRDRSTLRFLKDNQIPAYCQQTSTRTYGYGYHRGHLQGANTSENSPQAYKETFYMTNVLPMTKELNTGAWHASDKIIECLRDSGRPLEVLGGPIWDGPHASNFTLNTHGVPVPSAFWKIIKQGSKQIAWIMPNSKLATESSLRDWEVSVGEIQKAVGFTIPADVNLDDNFRPNKWYRTTRCDLK